MSARETISAGLVLVGFLGCASSSSSTSSVVSGTDPGDGGVDAVSSTTGCVIPPASSDCAAPLAPGSDRTCTLTIAGKKREVLLYAPKSWDPCKPAALVVDAHGSSETDREQAGKDAFSDWPGGLGSGFRLVADAKGFLVAQPQGLNDAWVEADADFMLQIPAFVGKVATVDASRVYMSGISNGGELTYWAGCKDTSVFRAFAPVSGFGVTSCPLTHPAPLIAFHSPDDKIVPLSDGKAAFAAWVAGNHCKQGPQPSLVFGGKNGDSRPFCVHAAGGAWSLGTCDGSAPATTCELWDQCDGGVTATFCTVPADQANHYAETGGHVLYINGTGLSLAAVAWDTWDAFAASHPAP